MLSLAGANMSEAASVDSYAVGTMPARLVAALAGVSMDQLRRWRRSGAVCASALPPRRGLPSAYSWDEFRRARLASLLLMHGLKERRLRRVLDEYCIVIDPHAELPTSVAGQRAIVKQADGQAHTAERWRQGVAFDFVTSADLDEEMIISRLGVQLPDGVSTIEVLRELSASWPLGQLQEFADLVEVRPDVHGGAPTLKGTRLETAALAALHAAGDTVAAIAEAYQLAQSTVERVLNFEQELDAHAATAG